MDKILMEKSSWYRNWHKNKHLDLVHFGLFLVFALFFTNLVLIKAGGADYDTSFQATTAHASGSPTTQPLLQSNNLTYLGAFRVPQVFPPSNGTLYGFDYAAGGFAYNPANNSLFIDSHIYEQKTAEITIPQPSTNLNTLPQASFVQNFYDSMEGNLAKIKVNGGATVSPNVGGLLVYNNKLIGTVFEFYDANNEAVLSHFVSGLNLSAQGDFGGMYKVGTLSSGFYAGYMASVPAEWQSLLGGPAITGQCCLSIITRTSYGPSAFVFNPDDLGNVVPAPATPLVYYSSAHQTLGTWDNTNQIDLSFNMATQVTGAAFPAGTATLLFIGRQGVGIPCYGEGGDTNPNDGHAYCYDPDNADKGNHGYPYKYWVWAYNANDLLAVKNAQKNPWDVTPYAVWELPIPDSEKVAGEYIRGVAYDPGTQRIFVEESSAGKLVPGASHYDNSPLIQVFQVNNAAPVPTPPPVITPAPTLSLSISLGSITSGQPITLSWSSTNATSCTATGSWSGGQATSGSQNFSPTLNSTYSLSCTGSGGVVNKSVSVTVTNPVTPPNPLDTVPPVISGITYSGITSSSVIISWTTNEASSANIQYGLSTAYGSVQNSYGSTSHSITLNGLSPNTAYNFRISAADSSGNNSSSSNQTFSTLPAPATPVAVSTVVPNSALPSVIGASGKLIQKISQKVKDWSDANPSLTCNESHMSDNEIGACANYRLNKDSFEWDTSPSSSTSAVAPAVNRISNIQPETNISNTSGVPAPYLTRTVYIGSRGADVTSLQVFLISSGYLAPGNTTGYFGALTAGAVRKFQCDKGVVCSGDESSTGYGIVGMKTRAAMGVK